MIALMVAASLVAIIIIILMVKKDEGETDVQKMAAKESSHKGEKDV